jgi:hypothetical protein
VVCSRTPSVTDAAATAADAFVFGYPLVLMSRIRAWMTAVEEPDPVRMRAPLNRWVHAREPPAPTAVHGAGSHASTVRSSAWLDLADGPVMLTVPETHGRFYALSLIDLWTNVFASVGARTTGTGSGAYVIVGPGGNVPPLPAGALSIRAPTRIVHIAGLTQLEGEGGRAAAHAVQDAYELSSLAAVPQARETVVRVVTRTPPVTQVEQMDARAFYSELAALMRDNPPRLEDRGIVSRMEKLGLLLDGDIAWQRLGPDLERAVAQGAARGLERVLAAAESAPGDAMGDWHVRFRLGQYGVDYLSRASAACAGLEPGPDADELPALVRTDARGRQLSGRRRYVLTFPAGRLPPVHGFWTLTAYDARQPLVDNPVDRYSIGDWNDFVLEPDGGLAIRIQHGTPPEHLENWLPAPPGAFNLLLRLCWPQQEVLDRRWTPPAVVPADT